jgi:hypothetical protein
MMVGGGPIPTTVAPTDRPTFIQGFFLPRRRFCASNPDISSRPIKSIDVTNTYGVAKLIAHEKRRECGIIFPPHRMLSVLVRLPFRRGGHESRKMPRN